MHMQAFLIGGILPALLLGTGTFLMKVSMREGADIPTYLTLVGATVCCMGCLRIMMLNGWNANLRAGSAAIAMGLTWSIAIGAMAYGISDLKIPVSVIAPLTNSNALVALALSSFFSRNGKH